MKESYSSNPQQKYIVKGAMATCMFGVTPAMMNNILDNMFVNSNGKLAATTMSLGPCFPPPGFGMCKMVPNMPRPCTCQIVKWDLADNFVTVNRIAHPLTKMSRGQCALGTPMCISFTMEGQIPEPGVPAVEAMCAAFAPELTPLVKDILDKKFPQITSIKTLDAGGKPVDTVPYDGLVTLVADTINHEVGDKVTFEIDGIGVFYGYVENNGKAIAKHCHFLSNEELTGGYVPKPTAPVEKIAKPLENNEELSDLLKILGHNSWDKLGDGFESELRHGKVDLKGKTRAEFQEDYKHPSKGVAGMLDSNNEQYKTIEGNPPKKPLTKDTHRTLVDIRKDIYDNADVDEHSIFQKVVCCDKNFEKWIENANKWAKSGNKITMRGSVLLAKDAKHLKNPQDLYDGLQLNYGTPDNNAFYKPEDMKSIYVVRYTTNDYNNAKIPVHDLEELPDNPAGYRDHFVSTGDENKNPFTGNGFTPANGKDAKGIDRVGTPELKVEGDQEVNKAIIVRIDADGTETVVGYKTEIDGVPQFVCYDNNDQCASKNDKLVKK